MSKLPVNELAKKLGLANQDDLVEKLNKAGS